MLERISYIFVEQLIASIELDSRVKTRLAPPRGGSRK